MVTHCLVCTASGTGIRLAESRGHSTWSDLGSGARVVISKQVQQGSSAGVSTGVMGSGVAVAGIGAGVGGHAWSGGGMGWNPVDGTRLVVVWESVWVVLELVAT